MSQRPSRFSQLATSGHREVFNRAQVIDLLLHLAEESDACIRSSALAQLGYCASMPHCSECLRSFVCKLKKCESRLFTFFHPGLMDHQLFVNLFECSSLLGALGAL